MSTLTPYQEQRRHEREEQEMQARCAEARAEEHRFELALRAWTKRHLGVIDPNLNDECFPLYAHNWYLTSLHYGVGGTAKLAKARRVKEVMDLYNQLQRLIWDRRERLVGLALRQVDRRYGTRWVYPKLP